MEFPCTNDDHLRGSWVLQGPFRFEVTIPTSIREIDGESIHGHDDIGVSVKTSGKSLLRNLISLDVMIFCKIFPSRFPNLGRPGGAYLSP